MENGLLGRIKACVASAEKPVSYAPATTEQIKEAEQQLGFAIPDFLRSYYLEVGNGGFGPGYGVIGLEGGAASDFGTLVETYNQLRRDQELEGNSWPPRLLPFCEWGCNIFSCVDCSQVQLSVSTFEDFTVRPQHVTLHEFFELWLSGADILSFEAETESIDVVNPFSGAKHKVSRRRRS